MLGLSAFGDGRIISDVRTPTEARKLSDAQRGKKSGMCQPLNF